jgi:hypothetical protein
MQKTTLIISLLLSQFIFSQTLDFQILKNCTKYNVFELSDKLNEKGFSLLNNNFEDEICNRSYRNGQYFSNDPNRNRGGEIGFMVYRKNSGLEIEINYGSDFENFTNIGDSIDENFKLIKTFYSAKYHCTVLKYSYNDYFYYAFVENLDTEGKQHYPTFLISKERLDECHFSY